MSASKRSLSLGDLDLELSLILLVSLLMVGMVAAMKGFNSSGS